MYYNFNPVENTLKITVFAYLYIYNENQKQDLSELLHKTNCTIIIRIVDTMYKIKKTKTKISILEMISLIEMQPKNVIAEYTNFSGIQDIVEFLGNQLNWLSNKNSSNFNLKTIDYIINNPNEKYIYLFSGYDFGYKIGVVNNKVVLITPEGKNISTDCDIDNVSRDFLQIVLDNFIQRDLYEKDKLPI